MFLAFACSVRARSRARVNGVDGVIDQDALGLDRVYVQAKRYADKPVTRREIKKIDEDYFSLDG